MLPFQKGKKVTDSLHIASSRPWAILLASWRSLSTKTGKAAEKPLDFRGLLKIWKQSALFFKKKKALVYCISGVASGLHVGNSDKAPDQSL